MLTHILAASENNVIGLQNELPWHLPEDFKYFKNKTWGMPIIMGRKSYDSLKKALPGRINIVVTKNNEWQVSDAEVVNTIDAGIAKATESGANEIFIIGGGKIFKQTMNIVSRIYLTRVHAHIDGDTFYPEIDKATWHLVSAHSFAADEKNNYDYTFEVWEKNTPAS